ncbi:MAG TPA: C1 family peptidase [Pyrinomonadaceae bacterium]
MESPAGDSRSDTPKTTHPPARSRRERDEDTQVERKGRRRLDAHPDRIDIRDMFYNPSLAPLPDQIVNIDNVPAILDQGQEGACCGFALAAVINFLLHSRGLGRLVSPRMLYEMARRYDQWPRENYSGSSARGAMKGWLAHGVCESETWPPSRHGARHLTPDIAREGQNTPGGAYFRILHRQIRDMHAALGEVGIIYCTIQVHDGWSNFGDDYVKLDGVKNPLVAKQGIPVIKRVDGPTSGHAIALVGYTSEGFIVQNSWGDTWGAGGFALLPYEDYMLHATDVWVAQVGVPVRLSIWKHPELQPEAQTEGLQGSASVVPLSDIRPYTVDVGPDGQLSTSGRYWTTEQDIERLFTDSIPEAAKDWKKRRLMLYLHSGFQNEDRLAQRIIAFRDVMLKNEVYPVNIMWESGVMDSWQKLLKETLVGERDEGKTADWLRRVRGGSLDVRDDTFELTVASRGSQLWREVKENARLASDSPDGRGAMQLLVEHAKTALGKVSANRRESWELHVVAHSIGSIFAAHAVRHLAGLGVGFKSLHLMAPAMTVNLFREEVLPFVEEGACPHPSLYIQSEVGERDDDVGPYGKSLLFLISNAFEGDRNTPLLGMQRFVSTGGDTRSEHTDMEMNRLFRKSVDGEPSLVIAGRDGGPRSTSRAESHTGFDTDVDTLNSILRRIVGSNKPKRAFKIRDLQY